MTDALSAAALYRAVRWTARSSALLFAAAQATHALRPRMRGWRSLYLGFMAAHAAHFAAVARYAKVTGGRSLFPGGRNLNDVGGWPTVAAIYAMFAGLAFTGWVTDSAQSTNRRGVALGGRVATGIIGAMFAGTYLGQLPRSAWNAVPAGIVSAAVAANLRTGIHP
jgi:ABC-type amino acid transport system permease subunit